MLIQIFSLHSTTYCCFVLRGIRFQPHTWKKSVFQNSQVKQLEDQLEDEYQEKTAAVKVSRSRHWLPKWPFLKLSLLKNCSSSFSSLFNQYQPSYLCFLGYPPPGGSFEGYVSTFINLLIPFQAKREADRRLEELRDRYEQGNAETERKLRRELKKTKALLRDAQQVIDSQVCNHPPLPLPMSFALPLPLLGNLVQFFTR